MGFSLPAGWTILEQVQVTAANQGQLTLGIDSCPELQSRATRVAGVDSEGHGMYVPPIGWQVLVVSKSTGDDYIWVDPSGAGYSVMDCLKSQLDSSGGASLKSQVVLALAVAAVAYLLFSE